MSLFGRFLGSKKPERPTAEPKAEPPLAEPKPVDESVLEWRRLNELPKPALKSVPLDPDALAPSGPPSSLHPPLRPARVVDEVPEGYRGDLYYRIVPSQLGSQRNPARYVTLKQKGLNLDDQPGQRLASAWMEHVAQGGGATLFAAPGELRQEFRKPLPARLLADAGKKPFPEYTADSWPQVSGRFRRIVEALEPGVHLFIPLDTSEGQREPELYVFYPGVIFRPTSLAIEASGMVGAIQPHGGLVIPRTVSARHFYAVNRNVISSAEIFTEGKLGPIFSQRAVEQLGDVLAREYAFMPMGVCEEPIVKGTGKYTRDGAVEPLASGAAHRF